MDPYVILAVRDQVKKSSVASGQGSEPAWNETFLFTITDGLEQLSIKIMDSDVGDDDFVGELIIPLEPLFTGGNIPVKAYTVKRGEKERGEIRIGLSFFPEA
uniref:C2 domain-containing protein n=1 Tax=Kalanchoe fedtschenkoi TaxID=63787 RepID=A0A7N0VFY1_KALFE